MATDPTKTRILNTAEFISKSEAARLRGVSRQAIWELVKRGRLKPAEFAGRTYLKRSEVLSFTHGKRGPYSRVPAAEVLARFKPKVKSKKVDASKWLSLTEAATLLRISPQAVSDLIRRRRLRTMVVGDKTLVQRASANKFKSKARGASAKSGRKKK
jgi:predicted DNA-binding protein YlxM (UPF0122 family)